MKTAYAMAGANLAPEEFTLTERDFRAIADMLRHDAGITLPDGKTTLVYSRLAKRLRTLGMPDFSNYVSLLGRPEGAPERQAMIRALTTNVTRFFREPHHFEHLRTAVLPQLLAAAKAGGRVRLWSAACSNGQEPYSLGLTILDLMPDAADLDVRILASDIDSDMVTAGRAGRYDAQALTPVPAPLRTRWFRPVADGLEAGPELRRLVQFRELNLVGAWPMRSGFDAIMCRNVAIYFDADIQAQVWSRFAPLLAPGAHLYIGHSERLSGPAAAAFAPAGTTIYRRVAP